MQLLPFDSTIDMLFFKKKMMKIEEIKIKI